MHGDCRQKAVGWFKGGRPVDVETGWKAILHCAPAAQARSQAHPAGRSTDPQRRRDGRNVAQAFQPVPDQANARRL